MKHTGVPMCPPRPQLLNGELWDLVFALLGSELAFFQSLSSTLLGMFALDILYGRIVTSEKSKLLCLTTQPLS